MYYIYHIPGVKIGCTNNPQNRLRQQTKGDWEILETYTNIDIASQREIELQKQYGYEIDKSTYKESVQNFKLESVVKAGRASATKSWQNHRERELEKCKKGGVVTKKLFSKTILQFDLNDNFIKEWVGVKETARVFNMTSPSLTATLNGRQKTWAGFKWKWKN